MAEGKLTAKMERFVLAYLESQNASQAARVAGYSPKTAFRMGQENMHKPVIKARLLVLGKRADKAAEGAVLGLAERKVRLSATAVIVPKDDPTHRDCISAIAELNKMDHVYTEPPLTEGATYNTVVFVLPDGTRVLPSQLRGNGNTDG